MPGDDSLSPGQPPADSAVITALWRCTLIIASSRGGGTLTATSSTLAAFVCQREGGSGLTTERTGLTIMMIIDGVARPRLLSF